MAKPPKPPRLPRVFACGCAHASNDYVAYEKLPGQQERGRSGRALVCTIHNERMTGLRLTCQHCGKVEVIHKYASKRTLCQDCFNKKFRPHIWRKQHGIPPVRPAAWQPSEYDIEYTLSHPWLPGEELAEHLKITPHQARKARKAAGLPPLRAEDRAEIKVANFFDQAIRNGVHLGGA